jgi:aminoglycoside 3'-phosphotransferase-2
MFMEQLPDAIVPILEGAEVEELSVGNSRDRVYRVQAGETYFLKVGLELRAEHNKLLWLEGRLPVPRVVHYEIKGGNHYLLTTALEGEMAHKLNLPKERIVELLAEGARFWHKLPTEDCPFDCTIDVQIDIARRNMERGSIDENNFELHRHGHSQRELFADLLVNLPEKEDLVVTHGDYCLPNILINPETEEITGFVDVGRVGVSDRYQDLALCSRSIGWNMGQTWIEPFMYAYGLRMDKAKYNFYTLLDEFFN